MTLADIKALVERLEALNSADKVMLDAWALADLHRETVAVLRSFMDGGWRLVPVEPMPEMLAAFWRQKNAGSQEPGETGEDRSDYAAYRAMLAASPLPTPPAVEGEAGE